MKYIKFHLPVIIAGIILAFVTISYLGRTHIIAQLFGTGHLALMADAAFFLFTLLYSFLLWQMRQYISSRLFGLCLCGLMLLCLPALF